jgi:DNA-directed RNA polymerases I, II, and III subunit RPABC1
MSGAGRYDQSVIQQIFKVKKTLTEMLRDRGYNTTNDERLLSESTKIADFIYHYERQAQDGSKTFKEGLSNTYVKDDDPTGKTRLRVFFPETPISGGKKTAIGKDKIDRILKHMTENDITKVIIVTETPLSPQAAGQLTNYPAWTLEHFMYKELTYNLTKHFLVPEHRLMSLPEITRFLDDNELDIENLPVMSYQDPISRYYGSKPGDIFEIKRFDISGSSMVSDSIAHRAVREIPLEMPVQKKMS